MADGSAFQCGAVLCNALFFAGAGTGTVSPVSWHRCAAGCCVVVCVSQPVCFRKLDDIFTLFGSRYSMVFPPVYKNFEKNTKICKKVLFNWHKMG